MNITCLCGCGELVVPGRSYRQGHVARTAAFKAAVHEPRRPKVDPPNPSGLCLCGCGQPTPIAKVTRPRFGYLKGHPTRYIQGHTSVEKGAAHHLWKGGRIMNRGYVLVHRPDHPAANRFGKVPEHRLVWEEANGRLLRPDEHIHHINGVRDDNRPENLELVTPSEHARMHASENGKRSALARHGYLLEPRPCAFCGEMFKPDNHGTKCCSQSHAQRLRHQRTPRPVKPSRRCPVCGTEFTPKKPDQKYCQLACYRVVMRGEVLQPSFDFG